MSNNKLPVRDEIDDKLKWHLNHMYETDDMWEEDFKLAGKLSAGLIKYTGRLSESPSVFEKALKLMADVDEKAVKLYCYSHMRRDEDNSNSYYQGLFQRVHSLVVEIESDAAWLEPELLSLDDNYVKNCIDISELDDFDFYIKKLLRRREYILSADLEKLLAMAGEALDAPQQIFSMMTDADMTFPEITDESGEKIEMTKGRYKGFLESDDRRVREEAYNAMYSTFAAHKNAISVAYSSSVKKDIFIAKARNYKSALDASLFGENIPTQVYQNLLDAINKALPTLHKYLDIRKKALKLDKLSMYDVYVPIIKDVEMKINVDEAKALVMSGVAPMGAAYTDAAVKGLDSGWVDVMENKGKTSGAYSWGCYDTHPFILMNYQPTIDSAFTLAHELGHAMHTYLSNENQPYMKADYTLFVAEVASTLNECLLTNHLLNTLEDKGERAYVLNHYLEGFRTTVFRQTMFAEFEMTAHRMAENGEPLTCQSMSDVYRGLNEKYFGSDVIVDDNIALEWMRIPHFYRAFYVYKYATGFSAAVALSSKILSEGQPAVDDVISFLSSGGSKYPIELLKMAGVDMTSTEPVDKAMEEFAKRVDEMAELI